MNNELCRVGGFSLKKTKKLLTGIVSSAMVVGTAGCSNDSSLPPVPDDPACEEWEWDADDGVWECDDVDSPHFGHYFYGGKFFSSKKSLYNHSAYQRYKSSSSFKGGSSGFGSGTKGGFGG